MSVNELVNLTVIFFMILYKLHKLPMTYLTSWDINVCLCLLTILPEDIVKGMIGYAKKTHEEFSQEEAKKYWVANFFTLESRTVNYGPKTKEYIFTINCRDQESKSKIDTWKKSRENIAEFKREWRYRSIGERQKKVVEWCKFGEDYEHKRHRDRLIINSSPSYSNEYTKNLWKTWEAGASSYYFVGWDRRVYISEWYEGIHPGRFFLFFRKNKILEERNRGFPMMCEKARIRMNQTPISVKGPYEQLIEDLRCLDGGGLGEKTGKKVEHIDDLFS